MTWSIRQGHALEVLRTMADRSVQLCVTSPPYFGLRDYKSEALVWGGDPACAHEFGVAGERKSSGGLTSTTIGSGKGQSTNAGGLFTASTGSTCRCGAWRGALGLEPQPELFIAHLVDVFREVRRVLRDDGVLAVNIGDSYAAQRGGTNMPAETMAGGEHGKSDYADPLRGRVRHEHRQAHRDASSIGLKHKDLVGIPWMLAFALRADGWYLRSDIIWCLADNTNVYARTVSGDGPVPLSELVRWHKPSDVSLWNGAAWSKVKAWKRTRRTIGVALTLRSGEKIVCTPEHRWPTKRGLIAASSLRVGDVLTQSRLPWSVSEADGDRDVGWFIGLYLAEGNVHTNARNSIALHGHKSETTSRVLRLQPLADRFHAEISVRPREGQRGLIVLVGDAISGLLRQYVAGHSAKTKYLRRSCWRRSNEFLRGIIDGYLEGDGHWEPINRRWRLGLTRNYLLASSLRTLSARLGTDIRLNPTVASYQSGKCAALRGEIRFEKSGHWNQKDSMEIVKISASNRERWFVDIEVDDEPHTFTLASGVLSHNCKGLSFCDSYAGSVMPESVTDRPTKGHEYIFMLTKSDRYYWDMEAVRERGVFPAGSTGGQASASRASEPGVNSRPTEAAVYSGTRNLRTVWAISPQGFDGEFCTACRRFFDGDVKRQIRVIDGDVSGKMHRGSEATHRSTPRGGLAGGVSPEDVINNPTRTERVCPCGRSDAWLSHFATFPGTLVTPFVKAATSEHGACATCGAPFERTLETAIVGVSASKRYSGVSLRNDAETTRTTRTTRTTGWQPTCECATTDVVPCVVLDPFCGSGTTVLTALRLGRSAVGVELNIDYRDMAVARVIDDAPLFNAASQEIK